MGNELQERKSSDEGFMLRPTKRFKLELPPYENDAVNDFEADQIFPANSVRRSPERSPEPQNSKRSHMSLIRSYKVWKSRHNHFKTHKEIKLKDEKKKTVNDIANQKLVLERARGWKVVHLMGQVDDLVDTEEEVMEKLNGMLTSWEIANRKIQKDPSKELKMLSELFKANIQRSKTIRSQMVDAKVQMNKIFDHKPTVLDVLSKYSNKRNIRRREKT